MASIGSLLPSFPPGREGASRPREGAARLASVRGPSCCCQTTSHEVRLNFLFRKRSLRLYTRPFSSVTSHLPCHHSAIWFVLKDDL